MSYQKVFMPPAPTFTTDEEKAITSKLDEVVETILKMKISDDMKIALYHDAIIRFKKRRRSRPVMSIKPKKMTVSNSQTLATPLGVKETTEFRENQVKKI